MTNIDNDDFVKLLKHFDTDLKKMPWKMVTPVTAPIATYLDTIFTKHIDVYKLSNDDIEYIIHFVNIHASYRVKDLILARLIWLLRRSETYSHQVVGQSALNKHIFNIY